MVEKAAILAALATVVATFLVSTLFAPSFLVMYEIEVKNSTNSVIVKLDNVGLIQATKADMFILQTKSANMVSTDGCLEGELAIDKQKSNLTKITFERVSRGISCTILLNGLDTQKISDVIITSEGDAAFKYSSGGYVYPFIIGTLVILTVLETFWILFLIPHFYDTIFWVVPELYTPKKEQRKKLFQIQLEIKSKFGITLYPLEVAILVELDSYPAPTLLEITHKVNSGIKRYGNLAFLLWIPKFVIKKRLEKLTKLELIEDNRKLNSNIKNIIDSQAIS